MIASLVPVPGVKTPAFRTSVALPDGRTAQVVVRTIWEAGEKFVDPPLIAIGDAVRGEGETEDANLGATGSFAGMLNPTPAAVPITAAPHVVVVLPGVAPLFLKPGVVPRPS